MRLAELNRALVSEIAARWGLDLQLVAGDAGAAVDLLHGGLADLVVGVTPDWGQSASLDYSSPYLRHGDRLMTRVNSGIAGFNNLRGRIIGILISDPESRQRAEAWADSINATVRFFQTTESGAALTLLEHNNANAIYADSLALLAHLEANPRALRLTERWYSRAYIAFALPFNDPDFRNLLDYTLQELMLDGALLRLTAPLMLADELPGFDIVPGHSQYAGFELARGRGRAWLLSTTTMPSSRTAPPAACQTVGTSLNMINAQMALMTGTVCTDMVNVVGETNLTT